MRKGWREGGERERQGERGREGGKQERDKGRN